MFIRNRCPSKSLEDITPIEDWTGRKPYVGFMRIFGSKVVALKKRPGRNKLEPKGESYILVGYSTESKAYRLWKPGTKIVIKHRDVRFTEEIANELSQNESNTFINPDVVSHFTEPEEVIDNQGGIDEDVQDDWHTPITTSQQDKRGPGRPKLLRTGKPGRPKKLYNALNGETSANAPDEPVTVEEALNRDDANL